MGKRKEMGAQDELTEGQSSHKRHKKHKKKHKKRREEEDAALDPASERRQDIKPSIKLKIKIGREILASTSKKVMPVEDETVDVDDSQLPSSQLMAPPLGIPDILKSETWIGGEAFSVKKPEVTTNPSDEEREWLDALEAGELDDYGEIRKPKDPSLLTARQRALLHGKQEHELLELPSGYKTVELTEEQIQRRQQRAKKRRLQAQEKREKDKKQTLERLLKKQDTKTKGPKLKSSKRSDIPRIRYVNGQNSISVSMPHGFEFPFKTRRPIPVPKTVLCGVKGCSNPKKYSCSKTGVSLCSLECYKKNLTRWQQQHL